MTSSQDVRFKTTDDKQDDVKPKTKYIYYFDTNTDTITRVTRTNQPKVNDFEASKESVTKADAIANSDIKISLEDGNSLVVISK